MTSLRWNLKILPLLLVALVLGHPSSGAEGGAASSPPTGASLTPEQVAASVKAAMDPKADPCQDFYQYACGGWLAATPLPADQPRWGRGFSEIEERNREVLRRILEEAARNSGGDPDRERMGNFYTACMDEAAVEKAGADPLKPMLEKIATVKDPASLMAVVGTMHGSQVPSLFSGRVRADFKNPDIYISYLSQGGLGLPDRDYYLKDDARSKELRKDYTAHVEKMLTLLGESAKKSRSHAKKILEFEAELARAALPRAELRDPEKTYHKIDIGGLKKLTPDLPWDAYLGSLGYPGIKDISVAVPPFMEKIAALARTTDADTLQAYLRWHLVNDAAPRLSKAFVDESFSFFGQKLSGQKENEARWKRCVDATDNAVGEILGRSFVEKQFAGDSKALALEMIQGIESAFASNLPGLSWMDDATRARALDKVHALANKIGYPDAWRDYSSLTITKGDYFGDTLAARRFDARRDLERIGKPVDKKEWQMTPPTVNAYYNGSANEMVFPAGIMQSPFFHRDFPAPMNYGGIGLVMGHELTHGFDDRGRKFDPQGRLEEWWDPSASKKFEERTACVVDLYEGYEVQPGVHLNGKLTLGENIADLGGVKESYRAYHDWLEKHPEPQATVAGLTGDQLFFVGFAQTWCTVTSPEFERLRATTDSHSAPRFRVQGPLSNFPAFARAFQCAEGTPMNPRNRCEVW
jgi:putative endopeptidase